ncbi:uncharacterized protein LOC134268711 [Saccostrea cucullata]|uniref:uncharacterized protein LOC134268711 n=1 Tax=Saccostrea cuccullata TaxID=36930 RepID=UPI002ED043F5
MEGNQSNIKTNGYDLPVFGLDNGQFLIIHIPALFCIFMSLICALTVLILSFKKRNIKSFFSWSKSERFVVYMAICDGTFNVAHSFDHLHIVISQNHVYPRELCEFYAFMLVEFITAQNLMVNIVAINAFVLIYFNKNINFGKYDWKILVWIFGVPFVGATFAASFEQLGPAGAFCFFDGVKGVIANICFTTVPLTLILLMNTILYLLTWTRIRSDTERIKHTIGQKSVTMRMAHNAARNMTFFVAAFFVQWWAFAIYGVWALVDHVPQILFQFVTIFNNLGGVVNLVVYIFIRKHSEIAPQPSTNESTVKTSA